MRSIAALLLLWSLPALGLQGPEPAPVSRVRLEARGRDIGEVIHLLAKAAGERVFIHPEVEGRITVKIEDLPFEEALTLVLSAKANGYTWRKIDGVYHVGRFEGMEWPPAPGKTVTETVRLRYRDARSLARLFGYVDRETLERKEGAWLYPLLPPGLTAPPQPVYPENALILSGSPEAVAQMAVLLRQLDRKIPAVAVRFQVFAVPPALMESLKLHWERLPKVHREGGSEPVLEATRDFRGILEKLASHPEVQGLWETEVNTENRAPAHLFQGEAGPCRLSLVPCIEPGEVVQLWFRAHLGKDGQGSPIELVAEGVPVPPGESLALYLPSPSPAGDAERPPWLILVTPRVVEEEG